MEYLGFTLKADGDNLDKVYKDMEQIIDNLKSGEETKNNENNNKNNNENNNENNGKNEEKNN